MYVYLCVFVCVCVCIYINKFSCKCVYFFYLHIHSIISKVFIIYFQMNLVHVPFFFSRYKNVFARIIIHGFNNSQDTRLGVEFAGRFAPLFQCLKYLKMPLVCLCLKNDLLCGRL